MITIRWVSYTLATVCWVALICTPRSPASVLLAGLFFICFVVVSWTYGAFERNHPMNEEQAARKLAAAKARVILAEAGTDPDEFTAALRARDRAEEAYVQAVNA